MDDLTVFLDDEELTQTAADLEPTLVYGGSKAAAGAWVALVGVLAGTFGAVTLSPEIRRSAFVFVGYLLGAVLLLRGLHPLAVRVLDKPVAWLAGLAFFWAFLLGFFAVMGASIDSVIWGYVLSCGAGLFIGLMHGSLNPGVVRREDAWLLTSLPLAAVSAALATYLLRSMPAHSLAGTALAGAIAGSLFMLPMGALLAHLWDEAHGLGRMGLLFLHNDNFAPKAVAYLDRAIALAPRDAQLYNLRGIAWSKMGEPDRASADWRKVTELSPRDPEPSMNRGIDFLRRGALDQAIEALQAALAIDPDHAKAHSNLGAAYERRGDLGCAIEHYNRAIALVPDYANAYSNRGYAYFRKGDYHRALEDCERAIALDRELGMAYVNRGHALSALGRPQEAADSYRSAIDLGSEPSVREEALRGLEGLAAADGDDKPR